MRLFVLLILFPVCVFGQTPDSTKKIIDIEQRNALPFIICPVEIHFNLYGEPDGYLIIKDMNNKEFKKIDITYPQYPFMVFDDCSWVGKYKVYTYSLNNKLLNSFLIEVKADHPQGKTNISDYKDERKRKKTVKKK